MRTVLFSLVILLGVSAYAGRDVIDPLEREYRFYLEFQGAMNAQQKARFENLKKEFAKRELSKLQKEAEKLAAKYLAETGREFPFTLDDRDKLKAQIDGVSKFLVEREQARMLADSEQYRIERDARNAQWEQQRKSQAIQADMENLRNELRRR